LFISPPGHWWLGIGREIITGWMGMFISTGGLRRAQDGLVRKNSSNGKRRAMTWTQSSPILYLPILTRMTSGCAPILRLCREVFNRLTSVLWGHGLADSDFQRKLTQIVAFWSLSLPQQVVFFAAFYESRYTSEVRGIGDPLRVR